MPYITQKNRQELKMGKTITTPGELNYSISVMILEYLARKKKVDYGALNEVLGVLESVKLEYYRMAVAPYEDEKMGENGGL